MTNLHVLTAVLVLAIALTAWMVGAFDDAPASSPVPIATAGGAGVVEKDERVWPRVIRVETAAAPASVEPLIVSSYTPAVESPELLGEPRLAADRSRDELRRRLDEMTGRIDDIDRAVRDLQARHAADAEAIKCEIDALNYRLALLEKQVTSSKRIELATLNLINEYDIEVTILVNSERHLLAPGKTETVRIPAGEYTFQVLPWQTEPQARTIQIGEERPIRLYRRPAESK